MKRFVVTLTDQHRAAIEAHRVAHGLRSHADALRHMIEASSVITVRQGGGGDVSPLADQLTHAQAARMATHDDAPIGHIRTPYGSRLKKR